MLWNFNINSYLTRLKIILIKGNQNWKMAKLNIHGGTPNLFIRILW